MTLGGFGAASDKIFDARQNLLTPTAKIARARDTQRGLAKFYFLQVPRSKLPVALSSSDPPHMSRIRVAHYGMYRNSRHLLISSRP
jgi:hypothetical protein